MYIFLYICTRKPYTIPCTKRAESVEDYKCNNYNSIMAYYKTRIIYERGVVQKLAKRFSVDDSTVRRALAFQSEGEQPDLIRRACVQEYGGVVRNKQVRI